MPRINTLLIVLCALLLSACGASPHRRIAAVLDDVESYINERPDSALAVLRELDSTAAVRGPARLARASLLHSMALDKCYIDLKTDSILAPAVAWYMRHGSPDEKLKTLYYQGRLQYNAKDFQRAIVTYTEALEQTDKATDLKYIGFVNQALADTYEATYQESEAFPYFDLAYKSFLAISDSELAKKTLYKEAVALVRQKRWSQAELIFDSLEIDPEGIEEMIPLVKSNHALLLTLEDDTRIRDAVSLFQEVIMSEGSLPSLNHWGAYAYSLLKTGNHHQAETLFQNLESQYSEDSQVRYWLIYEKRDHNLYKEAFNLTYQTMIFQDSLMRKQLNHSTIAAQNEYLANKALQTQQEINRKKRSIWMMFVAFVFLLFSVMVVSRLRIQATQREHARLQMTVDAIQTQLEQVENEKKDLGKRQTENELWRHRFTSLFQNYFNTLGKLCVDYEKGYLGQSHGADKTVLRQIDRVVADFKGDVDGHEAFEQTLNKYLNGIMSDFRKDYPRLKPSTYLLASYFFAGVSMTTVSVLMGLDVDVLYARKYRIKKMIESSKAERKKEYLAFLR